MQMDADQEFRLDQNHPAYQRTGLMAFRLPTVAGIEPVFETVLQLLGLTQAEISEICVLH